VRGRPYLRVHCLDPSHRSAHTRSAGIDIGIEFGLIRPDGGQFLPPSTTFPLDQRKALETKPAEAACETISVASLGAW
jgi:hypothetical protein